MCGVKPLFRQGASPLCAAFVAFMLTGCSNDDYLAHRDLVSGPAGEASATNKAIQTIDPWPPYAKNTTLTNNGQRAAAAAERYRQDKVAAPQAINTTASSQQLNFPGGGPVADK